MLCLDLFCGKGGWTNAFLAEGFDVIGFDIVKQPDYRGEYMPCDVLRMDDLRFYNADFAVCSSPCEEFSVHCMKHFHPNPKYPENGIRLFNHARGLLERSSLPYVMENVRCAEKFVGRAVNHCGTFYLWGNAVPAIFPPHAFSVKKGFQQGGAIVQRMKAAGKLREYRLEDLAARHPSNSPERREVVAQMAMIPEPIARAVAKAAKQLVAVSA